jgi:signal transduction histidine kinase
MKKEHNPALDAAELRHQAEEHLKKLQRGRKTEEATLRKAADTQALLQELQIHQIELEIQNEELRRSRTELEKALALYTDLYDFALAGYFVLGTNGVIQRVNLTAARLLSIERGLLMDRRLGLFISETDRPVFNTFLERVFATHEKQTCEVAIREPGKNPPSAASCAGKALGKEDRLEVSLEGIAFENVQECRVLMTDITERKRAEEIIHRLHKELEQRVTERTAQLEESNRKLEAFAYSLGHELRTPLRAVDGNIHILLEEQGRYLDDDGKRLCTVISKGAMTMGRLIDDLLIYSRLDRAEMRFASVDMTALASEVFHKLTTPEEQMRIDFHLTFLENAQGDRTLIHQVWTNLLENAIKFSSKKKRAQINVECTHIDGEIVYSVRDNGVGFDMQYVNKLFTVFQRLHRAKEFEGTGAGLAIVQSIIQRHGGRVWAEGEAGKGASFYFTLPEKKT